jgi:hypothetical protein
LLQLYPLKKASLRIGLAWWWPVAENQFTGKPIPIINSSQRMAVSLAVPGVDAGETESPYLEMVMKEIDQKNFAMM